tara:strand:- start:35 stop:184 length:150 start_codon:yes stop_codon:yes gene_type:complete
MELLGEGLRIRTWGEPLRLPLADDVQSHVRRRPKTLLGQIIQNGRFTGT